MVENMKIVILSTIEVEVNGDRTYALLMYCNEI